MPRFQLLVHEPGQEPRIVLLGDPIVVGRSRSADLTVGDDEVGRRQFRIEVTSGFVVLEGLGATNPTRVDEAVIGAGEKTTLPAGATIRVGKSSFVVESADATEERGPNPGDVPDVTMVAGPGGPLPGGAPPEPEAGAGDVPMHTMPLGRPGPLGQTPGQPPVEPGPAANPGQPAATDAPATPIGDQTAPGGGPAMPPGGDNINVTMQVKGFRPGGPAAPPPAHRPPGDSSATSTNPAGGPAAPQPQPPKPQPPKPPAPPTQAVPRPPTAPIAKAPAPRPPSPTPAPTPPTPPVPPVPPAPGPASAGAKDRPKTVAVRPEEMAPAPSDVTTPPGNDIESRLHQTVPRLFVKSSGLKRRLRLMKATNTVGRAENADVLLPHESVSEQHCEIRFDGENWLLRDLGSTNGCMVDGNHLRGTETVMQRNALIGIGSLHIIFLCSHKASAADDRRTEDRALKHLVRAGRVTRDEAAQIRRLARDDVNQSAAEILLNETALGPVDWANAIEKARSQKGLLDMILGWFSRR